MIRNVKISTSTPSIRLVVIASAGPLIYRRYWSNEVVIPSVQSLIRGKRFDQDEPVTRTLDHFVYTLYFGYLDTEYDVCCSINENFFANSSGIHYLRAAVKSCMTNVGPNDYYKIF
jgi:hypothetical protein